MVNTPSSCKASERRLHMEPRREAGRGYDVKAKNPNLRPKVVDHSLGGEALEPLWRQCNLHRWSLTFKKNEPTDEALLGQLTSVRYSAVLVESVRLASEVL